jgi:hypothetical protein
MSSKIPTSTVLRNKSSNNSSSQESPNPNRFDPNQRRLNPMNPTTGRVVEPLIVEELTDSNDSDASASDEVEDVTPLFVGSVDRNFVHGLLVSFVKLTKLSNGVDYCRVMCYSKQKNRMTDAEKSHEKKMVSLKKVISTMTLKACRITELAKYIRMPKIHLDTLPGYMEISSIIVGVLCDILTKNCGYKNVDPGNVRDYFHARFTNERNQANYVRKPKTNAVIPGVPATSNSTSVPAASNSAPAELENSKVVTQKVNMINLYVN